MSLARRVAEWVTAIQPLLWPLVVAAVVVYIAWAGLLRRLIDRLQKFSGAGLDFEFSEQGAATTRQSAEEAFLAIHRQLRREFDRLAGVYSLAEKRQTVVREHVMPRLRRPGPGQDPRFRCTIHVPDPLFQDHLYQLLDYYPDGGGRGRSFSSRVGLIGIVWRSSSSSWAPNPVDDAELIGRWGMTAAEADRSRASGRRSFLGVLLTDVDQVRVGVVYLDSPDPDTFGTTIDECNELIAAIEYGCNDTGLTANLARAVQEMRRNSPEIDLGLGEGG